MVSDRVGDFVIRLKNAGAIRASQVSVPYSAYLEQIALKLAALGYIAEVDASKKGARTLVITLAYDEQGDSKIHGTRRLSKPGRRVYVKSRMAHAVKNGTGARIISTPKGILSDAEARKLRAGGETLFAIW